MKTLIIAILTLVLSGLVFACDDDGKSSRLRYNALEDTWSYESPQDTLRYNPLADEWSYENPGSRLRYNVFENCWEYAK